MIQSFKLCGGDSARGFRPGFVAEEADEPRVEQRNIVVYNIY
jgi:hypothetical protein